MLVSGARFAGAAAARALLELGADVVIADARETEELPPLVAAGARFAGDLRELPPGIDIVVTSPGFRPDHPLLVDAARRGVDVIGEVEFAWRLRGPSAPPWLAVTGTNGKTTTVRMLESILRAAGHRALAVGNVGVSIIDAVRGDYDVLAVELSSFQLYWSSSVRPLAGAVLNLAPDHLDWHGSMADYVEAKSRIWRGDVAIGNADDATVAGMLGQAPAARRISFTLGAPADGELGIADGALVDRAFGPSVELFEAADVRPTGPHNVANALAAAGLARAYGVNAGSVAAGLRAFVPDPHRNQPVAEVAGVTYVDDSKATNPHAASASLHAYDRVVWIAGGQLKGAPIDELVAEVAPRLVARRAARRRSGRDRGGARATRARSTRIRGRAERR